MKNSRSFATLTLAATLASSVAFAKPIVVNITTEAIANGGGGGSGGNGGSATGGGAANVDIVVLGNASAITGGAGGLGGAGGNGGSATAVSIIDVGAGSIIDLGNGNVIDTGGASGATMLVDITTEAIANGGGGGNGGNGGSATGGGGAGDGTSMSTGGAGSTGTPMSVPEPASLALLGTGFFGLGLVRRYR